MGIGGSFDSQGERGNNFRGRLGWGAQERAGKVTRDILTSVRKSKKVAPRGLNPDR